MESEHLIIVALILVALYMLDNCSSKDKVKAIGPAGRIRYGECPGGGDPPCSPLGHIRTRREGFYRGLEDSDSGGSSYQRIRLGDRDYGKGHFIKGHIRHNNRNNMFSGMMEGCGSMIPPSKHIESFRFTKEGCDPNDQANCY